MRNGYWHVRSFRNYADYALTAAFLAGRPTQGAIHPALPRKSCAPKRLVAMSSADHQRYLLGQGEQVMHILGRSHVHEACPRLETVVRGDGKIIYPAESPEQNYVVAASGARLDEWKE